MKTIEIKLYQFNELGKDAKDKVLYNLYDINVNYEWWETTYEDAANIGLKLTEFDIDRNRHVKGEFNLSACEVAANIFRDHGETGKTYKTASDFMEEWQPVFNEYMKTEEGEDELMELEEDFLSLLLEDYFILLQNDYEYRTSEKAIIETIECNEYDFLIDGTMY